eukprot:scaffold22506_cov136-Isochrysis_galbana.AAC.3
MKLQTPHACGDPGVFSRAGAAPHGAVAAADKAGAREGGAEDGRAERAGSGDVGCGTSGSHANPPSSAARLSSARRFRSIIAWVEALMRRLRSSMSALCCSFSARRLTSPSRMRTWGSRLRTASCIPATDSSPRGFPATPRTRSCETCSRGVRSARERRLSSISSVEREGSSESGWRAAASQNWLRRATRWERSGAAFTPTKVRSWLLDTSSQRSAWKPLTNERVSKRLVHTDRRRRPGRLR